MYILEGMPTATALEGSVDQVENALIPLVRYLSSPRTWRQLAAATDVDLDRARYVVLHAVAESEPVRTTALAEQVGVDPSTMSRHVSILEQAGLVERTADPDDGRAQTLSLTSAGRTVMEKVRAARHDLITDVLGDWEDRDRSRLAALLGRLADDFVARRAGVMSETVALEQIPNDRYKWTALSNTTLGVFMAALDSSIVLISLPAIFRGIHLDPLQPGNVSYLLWMLMGYLVVTAVLVVTFGRLGDMYGRVRMYNAGFLIFTIASILLSLTPFTGSQGALWLIGFRVVQGVGGALLLANSTAILTDAFPATQRGMALGINMVAAIAGQFFGLVIGGLLADIDWRLVFWVNVPVGVFGTVWAYLKLKEVGVRREARMDWWGNITFALGLILVLVGITYGIQPYGGHSMGWTSPMVLAELLGGLALLVVFVMIERRVAEPMFNLSLFRIRAFVAGNLANFIDLDRARRSAVHADHLAPGHLAAAARLQLRRHAVVGRHLHAAAHARVPRGGAGVGVALGPLRRAALRHRRCDRQPR